MISSLIPTWLAQSPTIEELDSKLALDTQILTETFYFWTVVIMWLIHVGFMAYEAGAARRKNIMSTAMKNILTIAVVTPTFYYFGWYIYGCFQEGWPKSGHASPDAFEGFCGATAPWSAQMGPNLQDHVSAVFFLAFLLFSWTTGSIMSGALIERVRLSAYLVLTAVLGSVVWILDAAWGWSSGGWLTTRYGFHDAIASLVVHGVAGAFAFGVLLNLGPRIGKYTTDGLARTFRGHNTHLTLM
ncbi:MAG: ammonium transporter, partial [Thermoleophilia bacterium]|nr:ammonium transporter [Thermoleophilia bacterium]